MTLGVTTRAVAVPVEPGSSRTAAIFAHAGMFTAVCLQRFGIPLGSVTASLSLPILMMLVIGMVIAKRAFIPAAAAMWFAVFVSITLLSTLVATTLPDNRVGFSILSLVEVWLLYLPLIVRPRGNFDTDRVQRIFLFYVRLCAICGLLQFVLQFAHVRLFSWHELIPGVGPWTLENDFAVISPIRYGSPILRSNGFFLLEPSIFSQLLAFGIMLDVFIIGRRTWLPLYAVAYLTSYSGTGLVSLGLSVILVTFTSVRNATRTIQVAIAAALALTLFAAILPDQVATFLGRANELNSNQTSAHARYLAPFAQVQAFAGETRSLIGYGPGATARATSFTAGSGNAALQLFVDYGIMGLLLFVGFLLNVFWRSQAAGFSLLILLNFQLGGGYLLVPPIILLMVISGVWGVGESGLLSGGHPPSSARRITGRFATAHRPARLLPRRGEQN